MNTGFSLARARPHGDALQEVFCVMAQRGYRPFELDPNGDRPDFRFTDADGRPAFGDVKVPQAGSQNIAIKRTALETYARIVLIELREVYIFSVWPHGWKVDTVDTARARIIDGPRRPTGNGSRTDWVLIAFGGTDFDKYFGPV